MTTDQLEFVPLPRSKTGRSRTQEEPCLREPSRSSADVSLTRSSARSSPRFSRFGLAWLVACLALAAALFAVGYAKSHSQSRFTAIEQLRVGDRVLVDAPEKALAADAPALVFGGGDGVVSIEPADIVPSQWRLVRLRSDQVWSDGTVDDMHVETLQPVSWLSAHQVRVGATCPIPLDLLEMGVPEDVQATVVAIEPCPPIESGPGRVVQTTVNHLNSDVLELTLVSASGDESKLRPTGTHKFYSVDRDKWLSANELQIGERLDGLDGTVVVTAVDHIPGTHRVYNLTVQGEHLYRVSDLGVLVHNTACTQGAQKTTVIGRMEDLKKFDGNPNVDTWRKSGRIPGPDDLPVTLRENRAWIEARVARGDRFKIATDPSTLGTKYKPGKPNGYFTWKELQWLKNLGVDVEAAF